MTTIEQQQDGVDPLDVEIEFAPGWAPQPGDKIRGKLVERGERDAGFGRYPIYTLELAPGYTARTKDGGQVEAAEFISVHANRAVLRRKLTNARLGFLDEVGIKYQGPPEGTARSHRYRVVKFHPDGTHVEIVYDDQGEAGAPTDVDAATQQALELERDERDQAVSEAEAVRLMNAPLEGNEAAS